MKYYTKIKIEVIVYMKLEDSHNILLLMKQKEGRVHE